MIKTKPSVSIQATSAAVSPDPVQSEKSEAKSGIPEIPDSSRPKQGQDYNAYMRNYMKRRRSADKAERERGDAPSSLPGQNPLQHNA